MRKLRIPKIDRPTLIFLGLMTLLIWDFIKTRRTAKADQFGSFCNDFEDVKPGTAFSGIGGQIPNGLVADWLEPAPERGEAFFYGGKLIVPPCTVLVYLSGQKLSESMRLWEPPPPEYCPDLVVIQSFNNRGKTIDQLSLEARSVFCDSGGMELFVGPMNIKLESGDILVKQWIIDNGYFLSVSTTSKPSK